MASAAHSHAARPASRARLAAWVAGVGVLAGAAIVAWLLLTPDEPSPGPLGSEAVVSLGLGHHAGEVFGYGLPLAYNRGDEEAVLDRIRLDDPPPGLHVLNTQVAGAGRRETLTSTLGPPERSIRDLHPVRGYGVAPVGTPAGDPGVQLVFTLRADEPGRYAFTRVVIEYHVGDTEHRAVLRNGLQVCVTPRGMRRNRNCPAPTNL